MSFVRQRQELELHERSFLLFKPDALVDNRDCVETGRHLLREQGLRVVEDCSRRLQIEDVTCLWPRSADRERPLQASLLRTYMLDTPCALVLVEGHDAIRKCRRIKHSLRKSFAVSTFGNCVHAPEDEKEADSQLAQLGLHGTRSAGRIAEDGPVPAVSPAARDIHGFDEAASKIWGKIERGHWHAIKHKVEGTGPARLFLAADDINSFDEAFRALRDVFPHWSVERAIEALLHVDRSRAWRENVTDAPVELIRGATAQMQCLVDKLRDRRLNAMLVESDT